MWSHAFMQANHPLTAYRKRNSLTRADLARDLSVSKTTITRWEEGKRKIDDTKITHVASITGIPAKELRPDIAKIFEGEAAQ